MKYIGKNGEYFEVIDITEENCEILKTTNENELSFLWFRTQANKMKIDTIDYVFNTNAIVCLTEFHKIEIETINKLRLLRFNSPFYCILDRDSEVGCKGILFYGASDLPFFQIPTKEIEILEAVWTVLCMELVSRDELQLEMLQMMLKRILILLTRIYKNQINLDRLDKTNIHLVREFNFLVEKHFREMHSVMDYAKLLNKAPKTLANLFKKVGNKTPLQFIQNRLLIESHRLLKYTNKPISEIGYELGFNDVQSYSRFFKKQEGISPNDYRLS